MSDPDLIYQIRPQDLEFWEFPKDAETVALHMPPEKEYTTGYLAIFDLDGTLARHFGDPAYLKSATDMILLPGRKRKLEKLIEEGYDIIIVTNQKSRNEKEQTMRLDAIQYFLELIDLPITVYASLADDKYRKPKTGIWNLIKESFGEPHEAFYVGDADGSPEAHSDSDLKFAKNAKIPFHPASQYFKRNLPTLPPGQKVILMVGAQGSGKTTLAHELAERDPSLEVISSDEVGAAKMPAAVKRAIAQNKNVIVDATNGTRKTRQKFYALAKSAKIPIYVFWQLREGGESNKLREIPVPVVAMRVYYARFEDPRLDTEPTKVYLIDYWE